MPTFSCADLVKVQVMAQDAWANNRTSNDDEADVVTATAILENQTADLRVVEDSAVDVDFEITWLNSCNETVTDCSGDDCSITGTEAEANCATYTIGECKEISFQVSEERFRNNMFSMQDVVAKKLMRSVNALDEEVAKYAVAQLDSYAGVNAYTGSFATAGNVTQIPAAQFNSGVYGYLAQAGVLNKMRNSYILDGGNLFQDVYNADFAALNADGKDAQAKFRTYRNYFDLFNIPAVTGASRTYLVERSSVALANKYRYSETPLNYFNGANLTKFSVPSNHFNGWRYDVIYMTECVGEDVVHKWKVKARFDMFQNPLGCNADNTGVLAFECA